MTKNAPFICRPSQGLAAFDGFTFVTDSLHDNRYDRVLPLLKEEQILMCRLMKKTIKQLQASIKSRIRVLDVGTGSGVFGIYAAKMGCDVTMIDISKRSCVFAERNVKVNLGRNTSDIETVRISKTSFQDFAKKEGVGLFDLIILAPPYNPTLSIRSLSQQVSLHAYAGFLGQDCFSEQIVIVPKLISKDGVCLGNMMTTISDDMSLCDDLLLFKEEHCSKLDIVQKIRKAYSTSKVDIRILPILKKLCSTKKFLTFQYSKFLNFDNAEKCKQEINRLSQESPYLALVYFEITKLTNSVSSPPNVTFCPCIPKLICDKNIWDNDIASFEWDNRMMLHRTIVDHCTSEERICGSRRNDYLFKYRDTPDINSCPKSKFRIDNERFGSSIFSLIEEFFLHRGWGEFNNSGDSFFIDHNCPLEFIGINVAPYINRSGLQKAIHELQFWTDSPSKDIPTNSLEALLKAWLGITNHLQKNKCGVFNQHAFRNCKSWNSGDSQGIFTIYDPQKQYNGDIPIPENSFFLWNEKTKKFFKDIHKQCNKKKILFEPVDTTIPGYIQEPLEDLGINENLMYEDLSNNLDEQLSLLLASHWNFHLLLQKHLFASLKTDETSFLASLPLGTFAGEDSQISTEAYGAVWIFAKTRKGKDYVKCTEAFENICSNVSYLIKESFGVQAQMEARSFEEQKIMGLFAHTAKSSLATINSAIEDPSSNARFEMDILNDMISCHASNKIISSVDMGKTFEEAWIKKLPVVCAYDARDEILRRCERHNSLKVLDNHIQKWQKQDIKNFSVKVWNELMLAKNDNISATINNSSTGLTTVWERCFAGIGNLFSCLEEVDSRYPSLIRTAVATAIRQGIFHQLVSNYILCWDGKDQSFNCQTLPKFELHIENSTKNSISSLSNDASINTKENRKSIIIKNLSCCHFDPKKTNDFKLLSYLNKKIDLNLFSWTVDKLKNGFWISKITIFLHNKRR